MRKCLKYAWMIMAALYVLGSCKLYQQKNKEELQSSGMFVQKKELAQGWYSLQRDSFSRSWYFWTDSSFRFHPDSGLAGGAGALLVKESRGNNRGLEQRINRTTELSEQQKDRLKKTKNSYSAVDYLWIILFVLAMLVFLMRKVKLSKLFLY
ncbi:hypothetical protein [Sphingobacterium detergens]